MSFGQRLRLIFEAKGNAALDAAEDPTEVLNLSYEQQLEQLQNLRRAIAQVTTEEKHVDLLEDCPKCGMHLVPEAGHQQTHTYTCTMHPEVRQTQPGDCPKCGMHLVPA